ncbi:MAG: hypothetical protein O3A19_01365 [Planctomycetota bacterium]|jgi:hypothetical protein|nr:hypothetical protein [Planctomycetota bacterium]MDA1025054.1 hypothetical protein [Planctomycetota bacterium]
MTPMRRVNGNHAVRRFADGTPSIGVDSAVITGIVDRVQGILSDLGHQSIPPNITTVLDRLNLPDPVAESVLHRLRQTLPMGSVEMTA